MCRECSKSGSLDSLQSVKHKYYLDQMDEIDQTEF